MNKDHYEEYLRCGVMPANLEKCPYIRTIGRPGEESMDYCELMDKPSGRTRICTLITGNECPEWEDIKATWAVEADPELSKQLLKPLNEDEFIEIKRENE